MVRTFEYGETTNGEHYIVMEFIDGVSFQYVRESKGRTYRASSKCWPRPPRGWPRCMRRGSSTTTSIRENFLVDREHQVKLIDFGLAVPNTPAFRRPGNRTGTLQYMAPELIRREPIDERIDIFSLRRRRPSSSSPTGSPTTPTNSTAMMLQRINTEPLDPARVKPKLSDELCDVLRKLTARKRKDDRWPSMTDRGRGPAQIPAEAAKRSST